MVNSPKRKHILIPTRSIIRERKTHRKFIPDFVEEEPDFLENGKELMNELEETIKFCRRQEKISKDENFFFVIETKKPIDKEESVFNKQYTFSLQTGSNTAIVSADNDKLEFLKKNLQQYSTNSRFKTWVNEIKSISKVSIAKFDQELFDLLGQEKAVSVEIDLLPNLGVEYNTSIIHEIEDYFIENKATVVDTLIDSTLASIRAIAKPLIIRTVVQGLDSVWHARKTPELHIDRPQSIKLDELPACNRTIEKAETICLLDTGVDVSHPLLNNLISDSHDFTPDGDITDFNGHGTFDAGLAIFGDLDRLDKRKSLDATALLINAKVQSKNDIYNDGYIEKRIREAVEKYHTQSRIFSLSVMTEICASFSHPSKLAHTLDILAKEYNVLFVISAGNIRHGLGGLIRKEPYPNYLKNDCCTVFWGAEACTAVTVGGIALKENSRSVAKRDQPSPFTRRGEFSTRAKPDVVADGGNLEIDTQTGMLGENDPELGVFSLGLSIEPIAFSKGTSCSAPIVANIVARLLREYPDASAALLKALVIHSGRIPDAYYSLMTSESLKKAIYGKGIPSFDNSAYCLNNAPTFIVEDSVKLDETAAIPIFIPKIMKLVSGLRKIKVTLVYTPPVDDGVDGYALVDLDFQLFKQVRPLEFQVQRAKWDDEFRAPWDNVKTGTFSWLQSGWGLEWFLKIIPDARFKNRFNSKDYEQKYAAVITVEDPTKKLNLYDQMFPLEKTLKKVDIPIKPVKKAKNYVQPELFAINYKQ